MLGRVLSIEYCLFVIAEACSSSLTGPLFDIGYSASQLCLFAASLASFCMIFWTLYTLCGGGAAHPRFQKQENSKRQLDERFQPLNNVRLGPRDMQRSKSVRMGDDRSVTRRKSLSPPREMETKEESKTHEPDVDKKTRPEDV
uniref:Uncharacterized protein n=1 Tax=Entomoneis paludosa TaxID=265537 RepID=A0A7S2YLK7_9STRA|mmetsp:Transcript_37779/g.78430  ORF Transcript_37779/g.78430 Transcript_37779/m.78430 type:complete len:143 (+) Transcript_37779:464-892(+)